VIIVTFVPDTPSLDDKLPAASELLATTQPEAGMLWLKGLYRWHLLEQRQHPVGLAD
jgi:hypothetical protein